ncbi:MAG: hypothetical protein GF341_01940 [candidate division Zixibacteria bacterium]|nr:hypothetical protein [candidate division Zixibacteria bacterium]
MRILIAGNIRRIHRAGSGITLIEVLASMIILSLGLLTLLPMATLSIDANNQARSTDRVISHIQNKIEELRNTPNIQAGVEVDSVSGMQTSWWSVDEAQDLKKVIVEVTWQDGVDVERRQRGVTYMYKDQ